MRILRQQVISKKPSQQKNLIVKSTIMMSILQGIQASIINNDDQFELLKGSTFPTSTFYSSSMFLSTNVLESSSLQSSSRKPIHSALTSATTTFKHSAPFSEAKKATVTDISAKKMSPISTFSFFDPVSKVKTMPTMLLSKSAIVSSITVSTNATLHVTPTTGPKLVINNFSSSRLSSSVTLPTEIIKTSFLSSRLSSSVTLPTEITTASFSSSRLSSSVTLPTEFNTASFSSSRISSNVTLSTELNTASISSSQLSSTVTLSTELTTSSFPSSRIGSSVTLPTKFITHCDTSTLPVSGISTNKSTYLFQKTTIETEEPDLNTSLDSFSTVTLSSSLSLTDATVSSEIKQELSTSTNIFKNKTVFSGSLVSDLSRTTASSTKYITKLLQSSQIWTTRPFSDKLSTQQRSSLSNKPDTSITQSTYIAIIPTLENTGRTVQITTDQSVLFTESTSNTHKKRGSSTTISESASIITALPTEITFSTEAVSASSSSISVGSTSSNITDSSMSSIQPEKNITSFVLSSTLSYETTTSKLIEKKSTTESGTRIDVSTFSSQRYESTSNDPVLLSTKMTDHVESSFKPYTSQSSFVASTSKAVERDTASIPRFSNTISIYSSFYSSSKPGKVSTDLAMSTSKSKSKRPTKRYFLTTFTETSSIITTLPTSVTFSTKSESASSSDSSVSAESTSVNNSEFLTATSITENELSSSLPERSTTPFETTSTTTAAQLTETISSPKSGTRIDTKLTSLKQIFKSPSSSHFFLSTKTTDNVISSIFPNTSATGLEKSSTGAVEIVTTALNPFSETVSYYSPLHSSSIRSDQITSDKALSFADLTSNRPTKHIFLTTFTESGSIKTASQTRTTFFTKAGFLPTTTISGKSTRSNVPASLPFTNISDSNMSSPLPERSTTSFVASTTLSYETTTKLDETISRTQLATDIDTKFFSSTQKFEYTSTASLFLLTREAENVASSFIPDTSSTRFVTLSTEAVEKDAKTMQPFSETVLNYSPFYSTSVRPNQITTDRTLSSTELTSKRLTKHDYLTESISITTALPTQVHYSKKAGFPSVTSISVESTSSNTLPNTHNTDAEISSPPPESSTSPFVVSTTFSNEITTTELNENISTIQSGTRIDLKFTSLRQLFESSSTDSAILSTKITDYVASSFIPDTSPIGLEISPIVEIVSETPSLQPYTETNSNYSPLYSSSSSHGQITSDKEVSVPESTSKRPSKGTFSTAFTQTVSNITALPTKATFSTKRESVSSTSISVGSKTSYVSTSLPSTNITDSNISSPLQKRLTTPFVASTTFFYETTKTKMNETIPSTRSGTHIDTKSTSLTNILEYSSTDSELISTRPTENIASSFIPDTSPIDFFTSPTESVERDTTSIQPFSETISYYSPLYSSSSSFGQITSDQEVSSPESTSKKPSKRTFSTIFTESVSNITALPTKVIFSTKKESASSVTISVGRTSSHASTYLPSTNITDSNISTLLQDRSTSPFVALTKLSYETTTPTSNERSPSTHSGTQTKTRSTSLTNVFEYSSTDSESISTKMTDHVASSIIPDTSPTRIVTSSVEAVETYTSTIEPFSKSILNNTTFHSLSTSHGQITSDRAASSAESTSKNPTKHEFLTTFTESVSIMTFLPTRDTFSSEAGFSTTTLISVEGTSSNVASPLPFTSVTDSSVSYPLPEKNTTYFVASTTLSYETTTTTELNKTISTTQSHILTDTKSNIVSEKFESTSTDSVFVSTRVTDHFASSFIPDTNPTSFVTSSVGTVERDTTTIRQFSEAISNYSPLFSSSIRPGQITSEQAVSSAESTSQKPRTREISTAFTESFSILTALPTKVTFSSNTESASSTSISIGRASSNASTYLPYTNITDSNISSLPEKNTTTFTASTTLSYKTTITKLNETFSPTESGTHIDTKSTSLTSRYESTSTESVFLSSRPTEHIASSFIPDTSPIDFFTSNTESVETDTTTIQPFSETISYYSPLYSSSSSYGQMTSDKEVSFPESTSKRPSKSTFSTAFTKSVSNITALPTKATFSTKRESVSSTSISVGSKTSYVSTSVPSSNITDSNISTPLQKRITTPFVASTTFSYETTTTKLNETIPSTRSGTQINTKSTSLTKIFEYSSTNSDLISTRSTEHIASSFIPDTSPIDFFTSPTEAIERDTSTIQPFSETISNYSPLYSSSSSLGQITSDQEVSSPESMSKRPSKRTFSTTFTESVSNITALPTKVIFSTKKESASSMSISVGRTSSHASTYLPSTNISDSNISTLLQERITTPFVALTKFSYKTTTSNETIPSTQSGTQIYTKSTSLTKILWYSSTDSESISTKVTDHAVTSIIPDTSPNRVVTSSVEAVENYTTTIQPFSKSILNNSSFYSSSTSHGHITSDRAASSAESTSKNPTKHEFLATFTESVSIMTTLPTRDTFSSEAGFPSTTLISVEGTSSNVTSSLPFTSVTLSYETSSSSTTTTTTTIELNKTISTTQSHILTDTKSNIVSEKFESTSTDSVFVSTRVTDHFASSFIPDTNPTSFGTSFVGTVERDTTTIRQFSEAILNYSPLFSSSIRPGQITSEQAVSSAESTSTKPRTREISTTFTESVSIITALPTKVIFCTKKESVSSMSFSVGRTSSHASTTLTSTNITDSNKSSRLQERNTIPFVASTKLSYETTTIEINETVPSTHSGTQIKTRSNSLTNVFEYSSTDSESVSTKMTDHVASSIIPDTSPTPIVTSSVEAVENYTTAIQHFSKSVLNNSTFYSSSTSPGQITSDRALSSAELISEEPEA